MPPEATLVFGDQRYPLSTDAPTTVPAGTIVVELAGVSSTADVRLDGRRVAVSHDPAVRRASFAHQLHRDTGAHELRIDGTTFLFETEDAKLRIDGVLQLLDYLGQHGLAWNGTMFFSGRSEVLRDRRLDWQWLQRAAPEVLALAREISKRPASARTTRQRRATHGVPAIGATFRLLRQHHALLEEFEDGPLLTEDADGQPIRYAPREIVVRERRRIFDTPGNRRATALLVAVGELAAHVAELAPKDVASECSGIVNAASIAVLQEPFRALLRRRAHYTLGRHLGVEERIDARYQRVVALHREVHQERHWEPRREVLPERAYAGLADQIFQRFCAHLLADHLELKLMPQGLQGDGPHFENGTWRMWVDVTPPAHVLYDWRSETDRDAKLRPDIVLLHRPSGRVAVLDAKYRAERARATSESLTEVQLYLQAYGRRSVAVLYPPVIDATTPLRIAEITNKHQRDDHFSIFEIPILPDGRTADLLTSVEMKAAIETLLEP